MTQKMIGRFALIACLFFQHSYSFSQDINFKDLSRAGPPVVKRYSVDGIEADGREYLLKFDGVDSARVDTRNATIDAARGSGSSEQSSSRSSSNQSASKSSTNKTFVCEINCTNGGYRGKTQIYRDVQASSRQDAGRYLNNASRGICQDLGLKATTDSFSSSQCREK